MYKQWGQAASPHNVEPCFCPSMLLYKVLGFDVSMHAMLEYMQQDGITYEMNAQYKLACTHWRRQAGVDSPSSVHWSREAHQWWASLLEFSKTFFLLFCKHMIRQVSMNIVLPPGA